MVVQKFSLSEIPTNVQQLALKADLASVIMLSTQFIKDNSHVAIERIAIRILCDFLRTSGGAITIFVRIFDNRFRRISNPVGFHLERVLAIRITFHDP